MSEGGIGEVRRCGKATGPAHGMRCSCVQHGVMLGSAQTWGEAYQVVIVAVASHIGGCIMRFSVVFLASSYVVVAVAIVVRAGISLCAYVLYAEPALGILLEAVCCLIRILFVVCLRPGSSRVVST